MGNHNNHHRNKQQKDLESNGSSFGDEFVPEEDNFLGLCSQEFLAKGTDLLKRTRKGIEFSYHSHGFLIKAHHIKGFISVD